MECVVLALNHRSLGDDVGLALEGLTFDTAPTARRVVQVFAYCRDVKPRYLLARYSYQHACYVLAALTEAWARSRRVEGNPRSSLVARGGIP